MEYEEAKQKIIEGLTKKQKTKSKFYFNDLAKILESKPRDAKKLINKMVIDEVLEYWSSGSTSMYGLKGTGKQAHAEHEGVCSRLEPGPLGASRIHQCRPRRTSDRNAYASRPPCSRKRCRFLAC